MIFINRHETDPWFNIAAEEYFLKNRSEDIVMIWQCTPAVIVGKHQNTMAEVNSEIILKQEIPVIRRLSGGGTVYHDLGNINYTVIKSEARRDRLIDFREFSKPVIHFLNDLGISASFEGKNNLIVNGKKISGNSAHVHRNRVIHHGTLLFSSNLDTLDYSIKPSLQKIEDKAVQSVRTVVTNINEHLSTEMSVVDFKVAFEKYILKYYQIDEIEEITNTERQSIQLLATEKYKTRDWTFGYSPEYASVSTLVIGGQQTEIRLKVVKGIIKDVRIEGHTDEINRLRSLLDKITGLPHHPLDVDLYLRKLNGNNSDNKLLKQLFYNNL